MNRKGELQTSRRISSNLRIWQSYSRVQILKVPCAWYGWKHVARLGFEPLKFLYSEFLYTILKLRLIEADWSMEEWSVTVDGRSFSVMARFAKQRCAAGGAFSAQTAERLALRGASGDGVAVDAVITLW